MMTSLIAVGAILLASAQAHVVNVDADFNKISTNDELSEHVSEILARLQTFKVRVHPRIKLFYRLLQRGMAHYADRTADTLYEPLKYNVNRTKGT